MKSLILRGPKRAEVVEIESFQVLSEVLEHQKFDLELEWFVFVGESDDASTDPTAAEDLTEPVAIGVALLLAEVEENSQVMVTRHKRIEVKVKFPGHVPIERRFAPNTRIDKVTHWAKRRFKVDAIGGEDLRLKIEGTDDFPRDDTHLGSLLEHHQHELVFELQKEVTPQGS